jgi:hypothetical protein
MSKVNQNKKLKAQSLKLKGDLKIWKFGNK